MDENREIMTQDFTKGSLIIGDPSRNPRTAAYARMASAIMRGGIFAGDEADEEAVGCVCF
jgi:hypothetical protein